LPDPGRRASLSDWLDTQTRAPRFQLQWWCELTTTVCSSNLAHRGNGVKSNRRAGGKLVPGVQPRQPRPHRRQLPQLLECQVQYRILQPVLIIKVPPFGFVDGESLGFHGATKEIAVPAL